MTQRIGSHDRATYVHTYVRGSKIASRFYLKETGLSSRTARSLLRRFTWCYCGSFLSRVEKYIHVHVNSKRTDLSYSFMYSEDEVTVRDFYFLQCSQWISHCILACTYACSSRMLDSRFYNVVQSLRTSWNSLRHGQQFNKFSTCSFLFYLRVNRNDCGENIYIFFYSVKVSCKLFVS